MGNLSSKRGSKKLSRLKSKSTPDFGPSHGDKHSSDMQGGNNAQPRSKSLKERSRPPSRSPADSTSETPPTRASNAGLTAEHRDSNAAARRKSDAKNRGSLAGLNTSKSVPTITEAQKAFIRECWETSPHTDIGMHIYSRLFQKRPDIKRAYEHIAVCCPGRTWKTEAREFSVFVGDMIRNLDNLEEIEKKCLERGKSFAPLREYGFKPQFWVPMSEIMTTECLYLDRGINPVADVLDAWATLISLMLSSMRDGFYAELRMHRRESKRRNSQCTEAHPISVSSYNIAGSDPFHLLPAPQDIDSLSASGRLVTRKWSIGSGASGSPQRDLSLFRKYSSGAELREADVEPSIMPRVDSHLLTAAPWSAVTE